MAWRTVLMIATCAPAASALTLHSGLVPMRIHTRGTGTVVMRDRHALRDTEDVDPAMWANAGVRGTVLQMRERYAIRDATDDMDPTMWAISAPAAVVDNEDEVCEVPPRCCHLAPPFCARLTVAAALSRS